MRIYIRQFDSNKQTLYYYIDINDLVTTDGVYGEVPDVSLYEYEVHEFDETKTNVRKVKRMNLRIKYYEKEKNNKYGKYRCVMLRNDKDYQIRAVTGESKHPNKILLDWTTLTPNTMLYIANQLQIAIALDKIDQYI